MPNFADQPRYNFSEDTGIPLFKSLIFLALVNNNRGYCVKKSFRKDNILLCPRLKQFRFKNMDHDDLDPKSRDSNRVASYMAAATLMRDLLHDTVGPDAVSHLLEEPRDLFNKMERSSDERLIIYHPSLLSTDGRIWLYEKLYWFFFKIIPFSNDTELKDAALNALGQMAYSSRFEESVENIIAKHPLLSQIDSKRPTRDAGNETLQDYFSVVGVGKKEESPAVKRARRLGRMVLALPTHTIEHAFDKETRQVRSKVNTKSKPKKLWQYSLDHVVDLLRSILPWHLLKAQETLLHVGLWPHLQIDNFWARDLTWMGGVPEPTTYEMKAIVPSYGKRRQQA